jgi:hypothetical protein
MAINWKNVALAFLEGLSPLDALEERPIRPASEENLIAVEMSPVSPLPSPTMMDQTRMFNR